MTCDPGRPITINLTTAFKNRDTITREELIEYLRTIFPSPDIYSKVYFRKGWYKLVPPDQIRSILPRLPYYYAFSESRLYHAHGQDWAIGFMIVEDCYGRTAIRQIAITTSLQLTGLRDGDRPRLMLL